MADVNKAWRFPRGRWSEGKGDGDGREADREKERETVACMCIYREEREREKRTLRNFFAELISLMRPDHLTGGDYFFSFFLSFTGSLAHAFNCTYASRHSARDFSSPVCTDTVLKLGKTRKRPTLNPRDTSVSHLSMRNH